MPNFPIIDTHLHVWDQTRLKYSAFDGHPLFGKPYHVEDYRKACGKVEVEAMVFLECYADFWEGGGQYIEEIEFVEDEQKRDPGIKAIIPMAPLEWGNKVEPMLRQMRDHHPSVRGIRRIMEFDADPRALTMSDGFIEGVNLLGKFGWSFDINPNYTQMDFIREFATRIHGVPMILDHCGKPGIKQGKIEQFREDMQDLARHPDMWVKLSDLPPMPARTGPRKSFAPISWQRSTPSGQSAPSMPATIRSSCSRSRCRAGSKCSIMPLPTSASVKRKLERSIATMPMPSTGSGSRGH